MTVIEYNKHKISVPTGWGDITVGHYESFNDYNATTARERIELVAKICKVDPEVLLNWPTEVFNILVDKTDFLFQDNPATPSPSVTIDGTTYIVAIEDALTLGEWVDADEVQKAKINVIAGVLAIVCRPPGENYNYHNNEARAALFSDQPVSTIQGVLAFFLLCKQISDKRTRVLLDLHRIVDQLPTNLRTLVNRGGGTKLLPSWPAVKFWILIALLRYRSRKFLRSFNTEKIVQ